jgi:hypothetical protein
LDNSSQWHPRADGTRATTDDDDGDARRDDTKAGDTEGGYTEDERHDGTSKAKRTPS